MKVGLWSTTAGNNNATPPDGFPEGQAPSTLNDGAREVMAAIRTMTQDLSFFDHGFSPTFISTTTFSIPGDQRAFIEAGRQVKLFDGVSSGPIYRQVGSVSYTTVTTISLGAGTAITNSLSSFAISILSNNNPAIPGYIQVLIDAVSAAAANALSAAVVTLTFPPGTIIYAGMTTAPTGFLECNGTAVSRTTYAGLFAAIGTTWGAGDGSSTFAIPELRGEFLRVWDNGRGQDTSRTFAAVQTQTIEAHIHTQNVNTVLVGGPTAALGAVGTISSGGNTGTYGAAETRPRNIAVLACIKT